MSLSREDKALLIGALLGILSVVGGVLSGDVRYATIGSILIGLASVLKAVLGKQAPPLPPATPA